MIVSWLREKTIPSLVTFAHFADLLPLLLLWLMLCLVPYIACLLYQKYF